MKALLNILIVITLSAQALAQQAEMMFRDQEVKIGEQTTFMLSFRYSDPNDKVRLAWPQFDKMLTDYIEIVERTVDYDELIDTAESIFVRKQEFTVTCFEPGIHVIQPIGIELNDSMYYTNEATIRINSVEVDTTKGIMDIKENYGVDYSFSERLEDWFQNNWLYFAVTGGAIAGVLLFLILRRRRPEKPEPETPPVPAHITALKSLVALKQRQAWRTENKKEYYSDLTYTVRLYLEQRFGIQAIEHTTREIINDLKYADISEEDKVYLRKILSEADMVKFARVKPEESHGEESLNRSIDFVEKTKSQVEEETKNESSSSASQALNLAGEHSKKTSENQEEME